MPTAIADPKKVAEKVRWLRAEQGWTQVQLADKAGLRPRTIQKIEGGGRGWERTYVLIARAFGISVAELIGEGE